MNKKDYRIIALGTVLSATIGTMGTAHAYIDPSVTTYGIQAIVGIVVAVGAVATVWWRKAKKKVANTLHIDENEKKEVEDEIEEISDDKTK